MPWNTRGATVGARMGESRGVAPGFDFVRLFLALSVLTWHAFRLSYGDRFSPGPVGEALSYLIVPAFFALSGFLVTGSMVRTRSVPVFLLFRVLRIVPALGAEITLSALLLGPALTAVSLHEYFTDPEFARYFTNAIGLIRYRLPGVFLDNPVPDTVNGQLWTIPSELACYVAVAVLMLTRIAYSRRVMLAVFVLLALAETATGLRPGRHYTAHVLNAPEMLVLCFLCGCTVYLWRDRIPLRASLLLLAAGAYAAIYAWAPLLSFLPGVVAITYMTAYAGMTRFPRIPVLMSGDFSYGIYLYAFPIQQAVVWALPGAREWYWNMLLAGPPAILFAMASWFGLEKPALSLRRWVAPRVDPGRPVSAPARRSAGA